MSRLSLTFLGTGGAFTDYRVNYFNNAFVETEEGIVLLDCGGTGPQSLRELERKPWKVAGTIITHTHADHAGGLEQLIWERCYTGEGGAPGFLRTGIYANPVITRDLIRMLSAPIEEFTDRDGVPKPDGLHRLVEMHSILQPFEIGGVRFSFHKTPHVVGPGVDKPTYGILVQKDGAGRPAYYSADTVFRSDVGDLFPDALIFHDCTFLPAYPGTVHTHYSQLLTLPDDVRKRIVLMHHTQVPAGIDPVADGFYDAARRHQTFEI